MASVETADRQSTVALFAAAYLKAMMSGGGELINEKDLKELERFEEKREVVTERRVGERKWHLLRLPQSFVGLSSTHSA